MAKVKPVPEGFHTVTPYLVVDDGARAIEFYQQAFGAKEIMRMPGPDGKISHAEVKIGDSIIMLGPAQPTTGVRSPQSLGGSTVSIFLYLDDVDSTFREGIVCGRQGGPTPRRPTLGRPLRQTHRSVRPFLVPGDSQRGCFTGRDEQADAGSREDAASRTDSLITMRRFGEGLKIAGVLDPRALAGIRYR